MDFVNELSRIDGVIQQTIDAIEDIDMTIGTEHEYYIIRYTEEMNELVDEDYEELGQYYIDEIDKHKKAIKVYNEQKKVLQNNLKDLNRTRKDLIVQMAHHRQGFGRKGLTALAKKAYRASTGNAYRHATDALERIAQRGLQLPGFRNTTTLNNQIREMRRLRDVIPKVVKKKENLSSRLAKRSVKERRRGNQQLADQLREKSRLVQAEAIGHEQQYVLLDERLSQLIADAQGVVPFQRRFRQDWQ
jgi:hypothetical protein